MQTSATLNRVQELLPQLFQPEADTGEAYLKITLSREVSALLPLEQIQQTAVVPATQITPIPNLPEWVIGLINLQNTVLMAIDLPQVLGLPMITPLTQHYHIVVVRAQISQQDLLIGFVVERIQGLLQAMPDQIQPSLTPADSLPAQLSPYLQGILAGNNETEPLIILNGQALSQHLVDLPAAI